MYIRIFQSIILAIMLALAPPVAAVESDDKAAFKAANEAYREAVEADDIGAAVRAAEKALELSKSIYSGNNPILATLYLNYGYSLINAAEHRAAIEPLREGAAMTASLYGRSDERERMIEPFQTLGDTYESLGIMESAAFAYQRIFQIMRDHEGKDSESFAKLNFKIGVAYLLTGYTKSAKRNLTFANKRYHDLFGSDSVAVGSSEYWLGRLNLRRKKPKKALQNFTRALSIIEDSGQEPGAAIAALSVHANLVAVYEELGDSEKATLHCQAVSRERPSAEIDGYHPLYKKIPKYPEIARANYQNGWVLVEFTVTRDGTVRNPAVIEASEGKWFQRSALAAVAQFRYAPAIVDGEFAETTGVRNLFTFKIAN